MPSSSALRVVVLKPSKYHKDGWVDRFRRGLMPNATIGFIAAMTPPTIDGIRCEVHLVDEHVQTDTRYLRLLEPQNGARTLLALVGVQSNQIQRAIDLSAYARARGCMAVIGGPHAMTCDTTELQGRGVAFALSEAELIWPAIL